MAYGEASNAVLNNEASAIQSDEMDDQFVREYMAAVGPGGDFEGFLVDWDMSEEDVIDYLESNPQILPEGYEPHYEGDVGETDGDDRDSGEGSPGWEPEEVGNPLFGSGDSANLTDEQKDEIANNMMGILPAGRVAGVVKKGTSMFSDAMNKLFASKNLKANQLANRGSTGEVVKGASRKLKDSNLRPSITNKTADRYKSMSDRVKTKRAAEAATVAGAGTAMYLAGDMTDDEIVTGHPPVNDPYEKPKTQTRNLKGNRDADGTLISRLGEHNIKVDLDNIAREDDSVGVEEPTGPDMVEAEERPGWKKNPGANWWSVNSKSDYWQTDDGAEEAFELYGEYPSWVKQPEVQELDWSSWFK